MSAVPPYVGVGHPPPPPAGNYGYQPAPPKFNNAPPPYQPPPAQQAHAQQQSSTNVVVVNSQPSPSMIVHTVHPVGDHFLTLSIILTVLCVLFGTWYGLICTIPAMIFSIMARDADQRGDMTTAITHGRISLGLNITSLVSWVIIAIVGISLLAVLVIGAGSDSYCTSSYRYNYYYGYDTSYYYCFD